MSLRVYDKVQGQALLFIYLFIHSSYIIRHRQQDPWKQTQITQAQKLSAWQETVYWNTEKSVDYFFFRFQLFNNQFNVNDCQFVNLFICSC